MAIEKGLFLMLTLRAYLYGVNKKGNIEKGTQTLRGSHDIVLIDPVQVGNKRQLLMDWHVDDGEALRTISWPGLAQAR